MNVESRTIFENDNLFVLRGLDSESADLIYLDPPFNSNRNYEAPIGSEAAGAAFKDTWTLSDVDTAWHGEIADREPTLYQAIHASELTHGKSMKSYLIMVGVRLLEMKRVLKETGSIYLHCDPTASHYLKMLMDAVFSKDNFRNEIVWHYHMGSSPKKDFRKKHDIIFRYSKSDNYHGVSITVPRRMDAKRFNKVDEEGRRYHVNGVGKRFYADVGRTPDDVWTYCDDKKLTQLNSMAKERVGYPTQKPLVLLERIINASSNQGDIILDPFCGCATTCVAAEKLSRQWIGIDLSSKAIELVRMRLEREVGMLGEVIHRTDIPQRSELLPNYRTHKHTLYGKQEGLCNGCGTQFPFRNMTVDHLVPQSHGGTDHGDNLQLLCGACNSTKGTGTQAELIVRLKEQGIM